MKVWWGDLLKRIVREGAERTENSSNAGWEWRKVRGTGRTRKVPV